MTSTARPHALLCALSPELQRMIERADLACGGGAMLYAGFRHHCLQSCTDATGVNSACAVQCDCATARLRAYPTPATAAAFYRENLLSGTETARGREVIESIAEACSAAAAAP